MPAAHATLPGGHCDGKCGDEDYHLNDDWGGIAPPARRGHVVRERSAGRSPLTPTEEPIVPTRQTRSKAAAAGGGEPIVPRQTRSKAAAVAAAEMTKLWDRVPGAAQEFILRHLDPSDLGAFFAAVFGLSPTRTPEEWALLVVAIDGKLHGYVLRDLTAEEMVVDEAVRAVAYNSRSEALASLERFSYPCEARHRWSFLRGVSSSQAIRRCL